MAQAAADLYTRAVAITKSDTVNYDGTASGAAGATKAIPADAVYVGGAGIVVLILENGDAPQFTAAAGTVIPVKSIRVNSTTTTATLMLALYQ